MLFLYITSMATKKILVVDDSETVRRYVELALKGHNVAFACDGKEALSKFVQFSPDLVVTDYNMPRMNGEQFLLELRKKDKETPVIFLTTESEDELRRRVLGSGANGWITKPIKVDQFKALITAALA